MPTDITTQDLRASFDAEIERLITHGITDTEELIARRYYSQKERKSMPSSAFCGPGRSYPVQNESDFHNAVHLVGHADNPSAVKACLKGKAKANGWKLPDSWSSDGDSDRAQEPVVIRADGNHDLFTGTHAHAHPAFGDGVDSGHEHSHPHSADADHNPSTNPNHSHAGADIQAGGPERAAMPEVAHPPMQAARLYAPIARIDREKREVEGVATSEEVDSFGTVFSYEGSKKAFQQWMERTANVREMHDKKAVGKGITLRFADAEKKIYVGSRISRGAPDTWLKLEDGVLSGYSVGAIKPTWGTIERGGKQYPYLLSYELAELSLVDNASNPDAQGLVIARAAGGLAEEIIDITEPEPATPPPAPSTTEPIERAGARISHVTQDTLHSMRDGHARSLRDMAHLCGCDECQDVAGNLDPDGDGDIDIVASLDHDGDGGKGGNRSTSMGVEWERAVTALIERALSGVVARQQSILARFASIPEQQNIPNTASIDTQLSAFKQEVTATIERVMQASSQGDVHSLLNDINAKVERIAAQPAVGVAPILNGSRPVDKTLATDYRSSQPSSIPSTQAVMRDLQTLQQAGGLNTLDLQQDAARLILQMQQGR